MGIIRKLTVSVVVGSLFMRCLILFMSLFVVISCGNRGTRDKIDELLRDGNYQVECEFQGCFGGGTEKLEIRNGTTAIYIFLDFSEEKGSVEKRKTISWTIEKEKKLRKLFEIGIHIQDTTSRCTTTAQYVLTSWPNSIAFKDLNCKVTEKFEELVK
jgi:hypothetical protein